MKSGSEQHPRGPGSCGARGRAAPGVVRRRFESLAGWGFMTAGIDPSARPSGTGCAECDAVGGWWIHLRRCAACGHIGCCDDSPGKHASAHWRESGHPIMRSFEPGDNWFWNFELNSYCDGPPLAAPVSRPADQGVPGPKDRVPGNWRELLRRR